MPDPVPAAPAAPAGRPVSTQYRTVLQNVLAKGRWEDTGQGVRALTSMQEVMEFPLSEGFPMITERSVKGFWRRPIDELAAFANGVDTSDGMAEFGCPWWSSWTTPEKTAKLGLEPGQMGPGSYGPAFARFPTPDGEGFDQFQNLVEELIERPADRTHLVSPWIPYYQARGAGKVRKAVLAPCHGIVHVRVLDGALHLHMFQRSGDVPIGVPSNMIQYAALMLVLSQLTGYPVGSYYHTISDAHIYEDQVEAVEEMLSRPPRALPTVRLNDEGQALSDVHDFRGHHFELADYDPHPPINGIPVAV